MSYLLQFMKATSGAFRKTRRGDSGGAKEWVSNPITKSKYDIFVQYETPKSGTLPLELQLQLHCSMTVALLLIHTDESARESERELHGDVTRSRMITCPSR